MSYAQDLALHLRLRDVPEPEVADIVAEVDEYVATGGDPVAYFGTAEQYAARFPAGAPGRRRGLPAGLAAGAALLWVAVALALYATGTWERTEGMDRVVLLPALGILLLGLLIAFLLHLARASRPVRRGTLTPDA
jgi:hypothetical protein